MAKELEIKFVHSEISEERSEKIMLEIFDLLLDAYASEKISKANKKSNYD
ncbi:MAG: hypothetical protein HYT65_02680 [Candidatus Yanofskybacteria bacterium]|nr:hypothetical protein [Candidatus Yanofskybacteria bacterium]